MSYGASLRGRALLNGSTSTIVSATAAKRPAMIFVYMYTQRGSNPREPAWKAGAIPLDDGCVEETGIEPVTSRLQGERSTAELQPRGTCENRTRYLLLATQPLYQSELRPQKSFNTYPTILVSCSLAECANIFTTMRRLDRMTIGTYQS